MFGRNKKVETQVNKKKYYDIKPIMNRGATYSVIFGKRSNGKTHSALEYALRQYVKDGSTMAYIRRWKEDVIGARASNLMADFNNMGKVYEITNGTYEGITYYNKIQYFCKYDHNGKAEKITPFGYMFALSDMEHDKSTQFPTVKTIIFDEFISRGGYFPDEFIAFTNTLSTIIRDRTDVRIIMLGNTVNKFCPYFKEMGLTKINNMKQGDIDVYEYGESGLTVAVEYCGDNTEGNGNNHYFAFDNPKLKMITNGEWELPMFPHTEKRITAKDILFSYFILFNDRCFQCDIVSDSTGMFTHIHEKTTPLKNPDTDIIFTLDIKEGFNYYRNILKPDNKIRKKIASFYAMNKVFYSNNEVGNYIQGYLRECVKNG